jgi:hypothetical protein
MMKNIYYFFLVSLVSLVSCDSFLEVKPNQKMTVPSTLKDCDALLDDYYTMNNSYPVVGEIASDHYYLTSTSFEAITQNADRDSYLWNAQTDIATENWASCYKVVFNANQVLEVLQDINREGDVSHYDRVKGEALFFRAFAYMQLANLFTLPYNTSTADQDLGLVLRQTASVDEQSKRSSLKQTYNQILEDLTASSLLLPMSSNYKTRPTKMAAYAAMSRLGLIIGDYNLTVSSSKEVLNQNLVLIDYNTLNINSDAPFSRFNSETLFHATTLTSDCLDPNVAYVDSTLYRSYMEMDLRKVLYFRNVEPDVYAFKGKYDGENNYTSFAGLVLDEVYFNLAEAYAHQNKIDAGMDQLNTLLITRWKSSEFVKFTALNKEEALSKILEERRKSLIMRNVRWMDIKRLSLIPLLGKPLIRMMDGKRYDLSIGDLRYAFLIPSGVVGLAPEITQNIR